MIYTDNEKCTIDGNHVSMCNALWSEVERGLYRGGSIKKEFDGNNDVFSMIRDSDVKLSYCPFCGGKLVK